MASVIGVVIALLLLFVIMVIVLLYAYKKQKMCFKGKLQADRSSILIMSWSKKMGGELGEGDERGNERREWRRWPRTRRDDGTADVGRADGKGGEKERRKGLIFPHAASSTLSQENKEKAKERRRLQRRIF